MRRILVLGGSGPAVDLAHILAGKRGVETVFSLAGVSRSPRLPAGAVIRRGGFGARGGLRSYLIDHRISMVIDATHPFAQRISRHGMIACAEVGCPRLILEPPPWRRRGESWQRLADLRGAARRLAYQSPDRRVLLTVGSRDWRYFSTGIGCRLFVGGIERPAAPLPATARFIPRQPPLSRRGEESLMRRCRIDLLVTKDSGSDATRAKLAAAHHLGIEVWMIARPSPVAGPVARDIDSALAWIAPRL